MPNRGPEVDEIFESLASSMSEGGSVVDPRTRKQRVWGLARSVPRFFHRTNAPAEGAEVERDIARLRRSAINVIDSIPDRETEVNALQERVREGLAQFRLRRWSEDDLDVYLELLDDEVLWEYLPEEYEGGLDDQAGRGLIAHSNESSERHEVFAAEADDGVVGQVRLQFDSDPDPASAEISYWIGRPFWGRGFASRLVPLYTARSFAAHPEIQRIFARVLEGNGGSLKVLKRAGYRREDYTHRARKKGDRRLGEHVHSVVRPDYRAVTPLVEGE